MSVINRSILIIFNHLHYFWLAISETCSYKASYIWVPSISCISISPFSNMINRAFTFTRGSARRDWIIAWVTMDITYFLETFGTSRGNTAPSRSEPVCCRNFSYFSSRRVTLCAYRCAFFSISLPRMLKAIFSRIIYFFVKSLSEFGRPSKGYSPKKELAVISTSVMGVTWGLWGY